MSNKQNINEIALSTAENIADELIFKSATTFVEDLAKSVPVASIVLGLTKAISNYKTAKDQRQLLSFIKEAQDTDRDFIEKFFKDKNNTELGFEILGILDQTYIEKQAQMIFRTAKLLKDKAISKSEFDKYTYIITRLNNHLIHLIEILFTTGKEFEPKMHETGNSVITAIGCGFKASFPSPNMDLVSFGFLEEKPNEQMYHKVACYQRTQDFYYFYEKIFKG